MLATLVKKLPFLRRGGAGEGLEQGGCIMQMVSYLADEGWTDAPSCVLYVLGDLAISVNDTVTDEQRQRLWPLAHRFIGTRLNEWPNGYSPRGRNDAAREKNFQADRHLETYARERWGLNGLMTHPDNPRRSIGDNDPTEIKGLLIDRLTELLDEYDRYAARDSDLVMVPVDRLNEIIEHAPQGARG